jgi:hypothetical protein
MQWYIALTLTSELSLIAFNYRVGLPVLAAAVSNAGGLGMSHGLPFALF